MKKEITVAKQVISDELQLPLNQWFRKKTRRQVSVFARYVFAKYLRNRNYTFAEIGAIVGLDHSTVLYLTSKYQVPMSFIDYEKKIIEKIEKILIKEDSFDMQMAEEFVGEIFDKGFLTREEIVEKVYYLIKKLKP